MILPLTMAAVAGHRCKVIVIGDSGVGKTTLFHRILFGSYIDTTSNYRSTTGLDCFEKSYNVLGDILRVRQKLNTCIAYNVPIYYLSSSFN